MKHTPGPWEACTGSDPKGCLCCMVWSKPADVVVAVAIQAKDEDCTGGQGVSLDEAKVNARLIAAAPDLLAACEEALDMLDTGLLHAPGSDPQINRVLRAAIAKATNNGGDGI